MGLFARMGAWWRGKPPHAPRQREPSARPAAPPVKTWSETHLSLVLGHLRAIKRDRTRAVEAPAIPKPWPGVMPVKTTPALAQDSQIAETYKFAGAVAEYGGSGFMGYALLAELAQIPEFRKPSEIIANEMARKWVKLLATGDDDGAKDDRILELQDAMEDFGVQETFRRAFELDNFFGRSQIFLDFGGRGDELKMPLLQEAKIRKGSLKGLRIIEPIWTYPNQYNANDPLDENFYRPQQWYVMGTEIHASRLLTFVSRPVPDFLKPAYLFGGVSLSQLMFPYVENWLRTRQSVSDITHNFSTPVFKTNLDQVLNSGAAAALGRRIEIFNECRDNQGAMVVDMIKEDFVNVSAPLSSLDKLQAQAQEQMAAIAGIPLVKLFGITPSGLNASSDGEIRCFYDTIESVQERIGTPILRRVLDILQLHLWGAVDPDITFRWESLWSLDEEKLAAVRKTNAETDQIYVDMGALAPDETRQTLATEEDSRYSSIDVADVPDLLTEEETGLEPTRGSNAPVQEKQAA